jgi:hypothetical protein
MVITQLPRGAGDTPASLLPKTIVYHISESPVSPSMVGDMAFEWVWSLLIVISQGISGPASTPEPALSTLTVTVPY